MEEPAAEPTAGQTTTIPSETAGQPVDALEHTDEAATLQQLSATVRSQDDLEKDIGRQVR